MHTHNGRSSELGENHRALTIQQDSILGEEFDRTGQHNAFDIAPDLSKILRRLVVLNPLDVLLDDRSFVQIRGHEMSSRPNELHAPVVRLVIRPCTFEAGKEGVMNVDHSPFKISAQVIAENLHVASKNHCVDPVLLDDLSQAALSCRL